MKGTGTGTSKARVSHRVQARVYSKIGEERKRDWAWRMPLYRDLEEMTDLARMTQMEKT